MKFSNQAPATPATPATRNLSDFAEIRKPPPATPATSATQPATSEKSSRSSRSSSTPDLKNTATSEKSSRSSRSSSPPTPGNTAFTVIVGETVYSITTPQPHTAEEIRAHLRAKNPGTLVMALPLKNDQDEEGRDWILADTGDVDPSLCKCGRENRWWNGVDWECYDCAPPPKGYWKETGAVLRMGEIPTAAVIDTAQEQNKAAALSAMGIDRYMRKPIPEFTLTEQHAPAIPDTASSLLTRWGYRVDYIRDPEAARVALSAMLNRNPPLLGVDIETMADSAWRLDSKAGLDPYKSQIRLLQLADRDTVLVFDMLTVPAELLAPAMERPLIAHNAIFEHRFLTRAGLNPKLLHCSLLMARVATGKTQGLSLADCAKVALSVDVDKTLQVSSWHNPELSAAQIDYAALDAVLALKLSDAYLPLIRSTGQTAAYKRMVKALPVVSRQMLSGVPFDTAAHQSMMDAWRKEIEPLRESLATELRINPDSPAQLAQWLSKSLDADTLAAWPKTASGQLSTDADTLTKAQHPALAGLRRYKLLGKQLSTYGDGYSGHIHPVTGRIHAEFGIAGTKGGRFYCRNPNIQNPPRDAAFRALFKAPAGRCLIVADYSQVELRIAALLAPDNVMLDAYQQGADLHKRTAAAVSGIPESEVTKAQRQLAKACNFGLIYGMGAQGLAAYASASYGVDMPLKAAEKARAAFFAAYPGIHAWHSRTRLKSAQDKTVRTHGGLLRDLGKEQYGWKLTEALNTPVQGTGAECLIESLIALPGALAGLDAQLIHHVHDEILIECAEGDAESAKRALTAAMEKGFAALFPDHPMPGLVEAHSGPDWHSAKG